MGKRSCRFLFTGHSRGGTNMKTANRSSNKRESSYGITGRAFNAEIDPLIAVIDLRQAF